MEEKLGKILNKKTYVVSVLLQPTAAPHPMTVNRINKTADECGQNQIGDGFHSLRNRSRNDRTRSCGENELKDPILKVFDRHIDSQKIIVADE